MSIKNCIVKVLGIFLCCTNIATNTMSRSVSYALSQQQTIVNSGSAHAIALALSIPMTIADSTPIISYRELYAQRRRNQENSSSSSTQGSNISVTQSLPTTNFSSPVVNYRELFGQRFNSRESLPISQLSSNPSEQLDIPRSNEPFSGACPTTNSISNPATLADIDHPEIDLSEREIYLYRRTLQSVTNTPNQLSLNSVQFNTPNPNQPLAGSSYEANSAITVPSKKQTELATSRSNTQYSKNLTEKQFRINPMLRVYYYIATLFLRIFIF